MLEAEVEEIAFPTVGDLQTEPFRQNSDHLTSIVIHKLTHDCHTLAALVHESV